MMKCDGLWPLLSDTGMRLAEAVGLLREDIRVDEDIPYVDIRPHPCRRLKTSGSQRKVPLVGCSFWAAKQALHTSEGTFLFPKYCNEKGCNANFASAALNKWLKQITGSKYIIHSLRHSMRNRLREINCQSAIIDQLGSWSTKTVGETYGRGFSLTMLYSVLTQIETFTPAE